MRKKYIIGVIISLAVLLGNQAFIQYWLNQKRYDAKTINIAGRQRMLSQKIIFEFNQFAQKSSNKTELEQTVKQWKQGHEGILRGSEVLGIEPTENPKVISILNGLTTYIDYSLLLLNQKNVTPNDLESLNRNQKLFLENMELVVKLLEDDSDRKLTLLVVMEIILACISITIIILEVRYIYSPITSRLNSLLKKSRLNEQKLNSLYDSTEESVTIIDKNFVIQYSNKTARQIAKKYFGKDSKEGDTFLDFILPNHQAETISSFNRVLQGEKIEYKQQIGQEWWRFTFYPIYQFSTGEITGIAHNLRNITEKVLLSEKNKKLTQYFELISQNFPNGSITLINPNLTILFSSGEGISAQKIDHVELEGKHVQALFNGEIYEQLLAHLEDVKQGFDAEYQVNYQEKVFLFNIKPINDIEGTLDKIIIIALDITILSDYQAEIKRNHDKLWKISWTQAHDVRGPLATIKGIISLIIAEKDEGINLEYLGFLKTACDNLDEVIHRVVDITNED